jgi:hypothetical protein
LGRSECSSRSCGKPVGVAFGVRSDVTSEAADAVILDTSSAWMNSSISPDASYLGGEELCHPSDNVAAVLAACEYAGRSGKNAVGSLENIQVSDLMKVLSELNT